MYEFLSEMAAAGPLPDHIQMACKIALGLAFLCVLPAVLDQLLDLRLRGRVIYYSLTAALAMVFTVAVILSQPDSLLQFTGRMLLAHAAAFAVVWLIKTFIRSPFQGFPDMALPYSMRSRRW